MSNSVFNNPFDDAFAGLNFGSPFGDSTKKEEEKKPEPKANPFGNVFGSSASDSGVITMNSENDKTNEVSVQKETEEKEEKSVVVESYKKENAEENKEEKSEIKDSTSDESKEEVEDESQEAVVEEKPVKKKRIRRTKAQIAADKAAEEAAKKAAEAASNDETTSENDSENEEEVEHEEVPDSEDIVSDEESETDEELEVEENDAETKTVESKRKIKMDFNKITEYIVPNPVDPTWDEHVEYIENEFKRLDKFDADINEGSIRVMLPLYIKLAEYIVSVMSEYNTLLSIVADDKKGLISYQRAVSAVGANESARRASSYMASSCYKIEGIKTPVDLLQYYYVVKYRYDYLSAALKKIEYIKTGLLSFLSILRTEK